MASIACPSCGQENADNQGFCGACGAALEQKCPKCGAPNPMNFRFCGSCGEPLEHQLGPKAAEERRWATILFADLSGFTPLSEHMDPEDVRALVDVCMGKLGEIVEKFGGSVNRVIGDAILALFGAPVAHEDDAERAVRAALEMQRSAIENRREFGNLTLRIGINTGETMFAPVGPEGARHTTVMGDVVNTASRLQTAAPPGGILVGRETYQATRNSIRYEAMREVTAKGKEAPVAAWAPVEPLATPAERPVSAAPLVGRDAEMASLTQIWETVRTDRTPHLVTILGPAGIGKSRLSTEFLSSLQGGRVLRGRSLPYGESTGYGAFARQVKQFAGILQSDPEKAASEKLERVAGETLGEAEAAEILPTIKVMLGIAAEEAASDRQVFFHAARVLVEAISRQTPTVFFFEDLHWADESLLDLVDFLASRTRDAPALFLIMARPDLLDRRTNLGGGQISYTAMPLKPLDGAEARALALHLLEPVTGARVAQQLAERAGGNPLFIEELAASMSETTDAVIGTLPTNVKGIIAARLDSLAAVARSTLLDASVAGKVFWRGALAEMGSGAGLDEGLDILEAKDLIRREPSSSIRGETEYVFKHILIQEVAYSTLPKSARRERHASVARFIERAAGERIADSASLLAHHWKHAGDTDNALEYLLLAADRASRSWAKAEAVRLLDEALTLVSPEDARAGSILVQKAIALSDANDHQGVLAALDPVVADLEGNDRMEATFLKAKAAWWLTDSENFLRAARELREMSQSPGGEEYRGPSLMLEQYQRSMEGRLPEAIEVSEKAVAVWPDDRPRDLASVLGVLSVCYSWVGRFDQGEEVGRRAYTLGLEIKSVEHAFSGAQTAIALMGLGRHEEAIGLIEEILRNWRALEIKPLQTSRTINIWAGILRDMNVLEESRALNAEAVELAKQASFQNAIAQAAVDLLFAHAAEGEVGRVQAALDGAEEEARKLKGWHEWLVGTRLAEVRAWLAVRSMPPDEAVTVCREGVEYAARYGRMKNEIGARVAMGSALMSAGDPGGASRELRRASTDAERLRHPPTLWRAAAALGAHNYAAGDDKGAAEAFRRARAALEEFAATLSEEHQKALLGGQDAQEILGAA